MTFVRKFSFPQFLIYKKGRILFLSSDLNMVLAPCKLILIRKCGNVAVRSIMRIAIFLWKNKRLCGNIYEQR